MKDIEQLNKAIQLIANGVESEFCKYSNIKPSTVKTWRKRKSIPQDKILLLEWIIRSYEAEQKLSKIEGYFNLKSEISKMFQS